ncbi:MAG: amidohydrolase family protein [Phycisphaerales bacterium]|nr:MAG: amidohydrolase family protein [Phycisphaerales bacterium]
MAVFLHDALLVDYDPPQVRRGGLRADRGLIVAAGSDARSEPGDEVVDCGGAVVMPGLVNGHAHVYSALAPGMPAPPKTPRNFPEILQYVWWRLDRALDAESIEVSGLVGALDALRHGTTTVIDHHASPNCIVNSLDMLERGLRRVGLRGVLCYEVTDRNGAEGAAAGVAENRRYAGLCHRRGDGQFAGMIGAHASFTVGDETLAALAEAVRDTGVGLHIHVAEDRCDDEASRREYGASAIERLERAGLLTPQALLAHCIHLSDQDRAAVAKGGATVAHNPRSNMNNGVGYARVSTFGDAVALGTDGIGNDMQAEARFAWFKSCDTEGGLAPNRIMHMLGKAARRAGESLGLLLGRLEPGAAADVVLTDYRPATPLKTENLAGHLLFGMDGTHIRDVMIAGRWCLRAGQVCCVDAVDETDRARATANDLWRRMASL